MEEVAEVMRAGMVGETTQSRWKARAAADAARGSGVVCREGRDGSDLTVSSSIFFDFIQWKPTDTWPRDRCGRAQLGENPIWYGRQNSYHDHKLFEVFISERKRSSIEH